MLVAYPCVRRWEDTGDVLNAALVRLTRSLESVIPTSTREFFGLAAQHIRWELLDLARHYQGPKGLGRHYRSGFAKLTSTPAVPEPAAPASGSDELDWWAEFHTAVERLPTEEREAFSLTFYHGSDQTQVAEVMGVTTRTVRRYLRAASQALADMVPRHPPSSDPSRHPSLPESAEQS
jgi:RNA polymerase sigma-70 factor (ECF subfamily)